MQESIVFLVCVQRRREESSRSLSHLLMSFLFVVTEDVLFSIVALKTLDISEDSVATHLRCDGIFSDSIITNYYKFSPDSESEIIFKIG